MKAYTRKYGPECYKFNHPGDMDIIIKYLEKRGTLNITYGKLEELYQDFSSSRFSASWIDVDDVTLELFSDWLENYEIGER